MERYTSDKGRTLARTYEPALRELNTQIYHCMPWVEVQKESIGFFRPKPATQDDRYLSIRIFVEQEPSPQFASLAVEERASSMFSRYVGPLIRRMAAYVPPTGNPAPDGFTVIVEWLKQHAMGASDRPVHETMAVFVDRALALAPDDSLALYLTARVNLCDCVDAWSTNVEKQQVIGAEALEKTCDTIRNRRRCSR